jgi:ATP-binding cassette subfamily B protein
MRFTRRFRHEGTHGAAGGAARLLSYVRPHVRKLLLGLVITLVLNALRSTQPLFTRYAVDWYIAPGQVEGLTALAVCFLLARVLIFALFYLQCVLLNGFGQRVLADLRLALFDKLQRLDLSYFDRTPVGSVLTRLTSDLDAMGELFTSCTREGLGDLVIMASTVVIMLWMDWRLTLVTLATMPLLVLMTRWFRRRAARGYDSMGVKMAALNAFLQEHLAGALTVQLFNREAKALGRLHELNSGFSRAANFTGLNYSVFIFMVDTIGALSVTFAIWYGGWRVMLGATGGATVSIGEFIAFVLYAHQLLQPMRDIGNNYNIFQAAMAAARRIFKTLDEPVTVVSPSRPRKTGRALGRVEFEHVWFAYHGEDWVLKDVSFTVEPGQTLALVGRTGAGKTTLTNLLMRFHDPQRGRVLVDGVDVREWDLRALRGNFGVVLQDVFLFSGTIMQNIRAGRSGISKDSVARAAREAQADHFIERLPNGYRTVVNSATVQLSAGQKQLIALARALAVSPTIFVLDEATSSVDPETENAIQQAIERPLGGRTTIVIAHRLSNVQRADHIVVMHRGEMREQGSHDRLLAAQGIYWRFHTLQRITPEAREELPPSAAASSHEAAPPVGAG